MIRRRRGFALLLVLWLVVILSLLVYSILYQTGTEVRTTSLRKKQAQAEALARAGVARAFTALKNDMLFDDAEDGEKFDAEGDVWASPVDEREDKDLPEGQKLEVEVENLDGRFDLNQMNPQRLVLLQKIIEKIGYEEADAHATAAAIIDWSDADTAPLGDDPIGEEGVYYARIMAKDEGRRVREEDIIPIKIPNEPFQSVSELLTVYGVTPELYFGPDSDEAKEWAKSAGKSRGRFEVKNAKRRGRDEEPIGLRDYFVIGNSGKLNINTAPAHVLAAYVEAGGTLDGDALAERTVRKRRGRAHAPFDNDSAYRTADMVKEDGDLFGALQTSGGLYPYDIRGDSFMVHAIGEVANVRKELHVEVRRELMSLLRNETFESIERSKGTTRSTRNRTAQEKQDATIRKPAVRIVSWTE